MQQLIAPPRGAAARTLPTCEQEKRALRKELIRWTRRVKGKEEDRSDGQCQPDSRRKGKLTSSIDCYVNKVKIRHDLKTAADSEKHELLRTNNHNKLSFESSEPTLPTFNIGADKFFVRFCEVHYSFDNSNHLHNDGQHAAR